MTRLQLKTEGDRHVVVTRRFNATPEMVYRAHTEPDLIHPGDGVAARHALARFIGRALIQSQHGASVVRIDRAPVQPVGPVRPF